MQHLTTTELRALFPELSPRTIFCVDSEYAPVSLKWLEKQFWPSFFAYTRALKLTWRKEFDCDDFAREAAVFAQRANSRRAEEHGVTKQALAFAEFGCLLDSKGAHYFNVVIVENNERTFWEPQQPGKRLWLKDYEVQSAFYVRF